MGNFSWVGRKGMMGFHILLLKTGNLFTRTFNDDFFPPEGNPVQDFA
jgi:hypothetical protein